MYNLDVGLIHCKTFKYIWNRNKYCWESLHSKSRESKALFTCMYIHFQHFLYLTPSVFTLSSNWAMCYPEHPSPTHTSNINMVYISRHVQCIHFRMQRFELETGLYHNNAEHTIFQLLFLKLQWVKCFKKKNVCCILLNILK